MQKSGIYNVISIAGSDSNFHEKGEKVLPIG